MKILLVQSGKKSDKRQAMMPLSLPLLVSVAPEHDYTLIDLSNGEKVNYKEQYDLVGISVRSTTEEYAFEVARRMRNEKRITVILGGPFVSGAPFEAAAHADAVAIGEGEGLWPVILSDFKNKKLKRFYVSDKFPFDGKGGSVYQKNEFEDLSEITHIRYNLYKKKYPLMPVFSTRGCPINCDYCCVTSMFGKRLRMRNVDDVVKDIDQLGKTFFLIDDNVFGLPDLYDYYIELYSKITTLKKKRYWVGQANLAAVENEKGKRVIECAVKSGLSYVMIGLESNDVNVLRSSNAIHKMGDDLIVNGVEATKQKIKYLQKLGLIISGWFVVGHEPDTKRTFIENAEFCNELNITPGIVPLRLHPGTALYRKAKENGELDNSRIINWKRSRLDDKQVIEAMKIVYISGYSFKKIIRRCIYNFSNFKDHRLIRVIFNFVNDCIFKFGFIYFFNEEKTKNILK